MVLGQLSGPRVREWEEGRAQRIVNVSGRLIGGGGRQAPVVSLQVFPIKEMWKGHKDIQKCQERVTLVPETHLSRMQTSLFFFFWQHSAVLRVNS